MKVKFKRAYAQAVTPAYSKPGDAGMDLTAISRTLIDERDYGYIEYGTGIHIQLESGYVGLLFPRSSISNTGMLLANAVGVVDSGYTGEIKLRFKHIPDTKAYEIGDRVAQLVIIPVPVIELEEVEELIETERSNGGFGSTNI